MGHTNALTRVWFLEEANYAGGHAGDEYEMAHPTAADALTSVNVLSGNGKYKGKEFKRARWTAPGIALGKGLVFNKTVEFPEIEFTYALQGTADPFLTAANPAATAKGTVGKSYIMQIAVPDETEGVALKYYCLFGCQITSYSVDGSFDTDTPPLVTVKFSCYDLAVNTGTVQTGVWPVGTVDEWENMVVTLDSDAITELSKFTLTVTLEYNDIKVGGSGTFAKVKPMINDQKLEYKVSYFVDTADLLVRTFVEALVPFPVIWTDGTQILTVTNCYVDTDNYLEVDNKNINVMEYESTIMSGDSAFTVS